MTHLVVTPSLFFVFDFFYGENFILIISFYLPYLPITVAVFLTNSHSNKQNLFRNHPDALI